MNANMKKIVNVATPAVCVVALALSVVAFNKTNAATTPDPSPAVANVTAGQPVDLTFAAEKALPSVVYIKNTQNSKVQTVEYSDPFEDFFSDPFGGFFGRGQGQGNGGRRQRQVQTPKRVAAGSGVIISTDGYIVTNNHVVDGADELLVTLNDNKEYSARIIGADATTDLALIKIDGKNLPAIQIANSDDVKVGEWVLAVGNPLGLNNTVTAGIVSAKARSMQEPGKVTSMIQTDAAINQGNSGGALVNTSGALIGINAMIYSQTGSNIGYGFATDSAVVMDFSQNDTLYVHADSIKLYTYNINTDSVYRVMHGFHKVRAYRTDIQAVCDSLVFNSKDSCLTLYKDPIAWNMGRQVLGEVMHAYMQDSTIRYADVIGQAMSIERMDSAHYNQLASKEMQVYFQEGKARETWAIGNVQAVYYPIDDADTTIIGLNFLETDTMKMYLSPERKLEKIWASKSTGTMYPITQIPPDRLHLPAFAWFDYIRPKNKDDIFIWRGKGKEKELKQEKRREAPKRKLE